MIVFIMIMIIITNYSVIIIIIMMVKKASFSVPGKTKYVHVTKNHINEEDALDVKLERFTEQWWLTAVVENADNILQSII